MATGQVKIQLNLSGGRVKILRLFNPCFKLKTYHLNVSLIGEEYSQRDRSWCAL